VIPDNISCRIGSRYRNKDYAGGKTQPCLANKKKANFTMDKVYYAYHNHYQEKKLLAT